MRALAFALAVIVALLIAPLRVAAQPPGKMARVGVVMGGYEQAAVSRQRCSGKPCASNILVHGYLDIDHGRLFDELGWIEDAAELAVVIERWLEKNVDLGSSV